MIYERLYQASEWFEELGPVIWPPYVGTMLDLDFDPIWCTHFSLLPNVIDADGERIHSPSYQRFVDLLNNNIPSCVGGKGE